MLFFIADHEEVKRENDLIDVERPDTNQLAGLIHVCVNRGIDGDDPVESPGGAWLE